jgi:hypothetical protein
VARRGPTAEDRVEAIRIALGGLAAGADANELTGRLAPLHPRNDTFPGEVLLELAADALTEAGASRERPVDYTDIRARFLPECEFRSSEHRKSHFALHAAAMIHGGVQPDLLEEVVWWRTDDFWQYALYAFVVYTRVAAERTGEPIEVVTSRIAQRQQVTITSG